MTELVLESTTGGFCWEVRPVPTLTSAKLFVKVIEAFEVFGGGKQRKHSRMLL
jgi:hypothetical protein